MKDYLREPIADLTKRQANLDVSWKDIRALKAKKLIALDKCPGVRPIGIGLVLDRLCAKVMIEITGDDVQQECLADQLASGIKSGIEGAIHAFNDLFDQLAKDGWGFLLVDASNAFNSVSRPAALWNARILWSRCSRYLFNSYKGFALLMIAGSEAILLSQEGVTQGDPLAMLLYGIAILPLIRQLKNPDISKQNWFADDSACFAALNDLVGWLKKLIELGPKYGYFPEPEKSYVIVNPDCLLKAREIFQEFDINVVEGSRFLGGYIGAEEEKTNWLEKKIDTWVICISILSNAAIQFPQEAFTGFTKCLQSEWFFTQRVLGGKGDHFSRLKDCIRNIFLPKLFGHVLSEEENDLVCRPAILLVCKKNRMKKS